MKHAFAAWLAISAAALLLTGCEQSARSQQFTQADYFVESPGLDQNRPAPATHSLPATSNWRHIDLPHVMRRPSVLDPLSHSDANTWHTQWYRFEWRSSAAGMPLAIYIPRWHPTIGRLVVYANGMRLDNTGAEGWNNPVLIAIPDEVSDRSTVEVLMGVTLVPAGGGAISTVWVGPLEELRQRFAWRQFLQITMPQILSAAFLVLGAFAFTFWWRRREAMYLLFSVSAVVSFLRSLRYSISDPLFLDEWFWWLTVNSSGWLLVVGYFFASRLHGQRFPKFERVVIALIASTTLGSLILPIFSLNPHSVAPGLYAIQGFIGLAVIAATAIGAARGRTREGTLVAAALIVWFVLAMHDLLLQNWGVDLEGIHLLPYGSVLMLAVFLYAVLRRYLAALADSEAANATLEARLVERSREIERSHARLREIEREQAVTLERQRLMREMHDGLGSSLMSSLFLVEQGAIDRADVARILRESVDDLKLTIDSLEPNGEDLLTLLGTLRYRLGKRIEAAGLRLQWHVSDTPRLTWLNPASSLHVLRIVQEALTNTLKHARARMLSVAIGATDKQVFVRVSDDGAGFDVGAGMNAEQGRGLRNLHRRASILGGRIDIQSRPGETVVTLWLPLERE